MPVTEHVRGPDYSADMLPEPVAGEPPAVVLWVDASIDYSYLLGGFAVVRQDGTVESTKQVPGARSSVALERAAILEGLRIAAELVAEGIRPIEVRTDSTSARAAISVRRSLRGHVRLRWMGRNGNMAHDEAYLAARR